MRIVIVGAGQAGASAAAALRAGGHSGPIRMVGEEPLPPYQRPPLSKKYLLGELGVERLYLRPDSFWAEQGIDVMTLETAEAIDRQARHVILRSGATLAYDALILATGAAPRPLPAAAGGNLAGVHLVRSLSDVDQLAPAVAPGGRLLVIGGGYIGLEAAAVAASREMAVTVIEAAPRILNRVAAPATADYFRDLHARHGVRLIEGAGPARLTGNGRIEGAVLADGTEVPADLAIVGIGVVPRTALAEASGLATDNGIAVDAYGRTSDPAIWAAGDCASFPWKGARIRLESVPNAIDQAEAVAANVLGAGAPYVAKPWFWSDQYDVKLQIAGLNAGWDRTIQRPGARSGAQSVWYVGGDRLLAVDAMNDPRAYMTGKRWIEADRTPDLDRLADPAEDLRAL